MKPTEGRVHKKRVAADVDLSKFSDIFGIGPSNRTSSTTTSVSRVSHSRNKRLTMPKRKTKTDQESTGDIINDINNAMEIPKEQKDGSYSQ